MKTRILDRRHFMFGCAILILVFATMLAWQGALAGSQYEIDDLAIGGYDAVGYFESRDAIPGDPRYAHDWNGATWHFASAANRDRFAADPQAYAPQYDGYCAYAAAYESKAHGDPEFWEIVDGKLYLNFNSGVQRRWQRDIPGFISRADTAWPSVNP